jgi:hypothetical protein
MITAISNSSGLSSPVTASAALRQTSDEAVRRPDVPARPEAAAPAEDDLTVVTISAQAASQVAEPDAQAEAEPAPEPTVTPRPPKPDLAYEAADTDKDGKISSYEQQSYNFRHPEAIKARLNEAELSRAASADLKAYEEVARAGRNF